MKKYWQSVICTVLAAVLLLAPLAVHAQNNIINKILEAYPGYRFDKTLQSLSTRDYSFSGCIPELAENGVYMYVSVQNYDRAPKYLLIISVGEQLHDFTVVKIETATTDYTFTTDQTNEIYSKTFNIPCSPNGKTPDLINEMLASETVTIRLEGGEKHPDLCFEMNDAQRKLIDLSYQYYTSAMKKADKNKLTVQEWMIDSSLSFIVTKKPHAD